MHFATNRVDRVVQPRRFARCWVETFAMEHVSGSEENYVSTLVAIAYPNVDTAKQALTTLARLQKERLIELEDAVIARNDDGKIKLDQALNTTAAGALRGAFWGGLIGMLFLMPIASMAIGAASGAHSGKLSDYGVDDKFVKEVGAEVTPGTAALFVLIKKSTPDKVIAEMKQFGGAVLRTNLSDDAEQRLQAALSGESACHPAFPVNPNAVAGNDQGVFLRDSPPPSAYTPPQTSRRMKDFATLTRSRQWREEIRAAKQPLVGAGEF